MFTSAKRGFYFKIITLVVSLAAFYTSYWIYMNSAKSNSSHLFLENAALISVVIFGVFFIGVILAQLSDVIFDLKKFLQRKK